MSADALIRLGFLYPPCGAEDELYHYGELAAPNIRVTLIGTRIFGDDDEHAVHHLKRTGELDNLRRSAEILGRLKPSVVIWACTSGSFVDGLDHARAQADAVGEAAGCAGSSTSLAFARACAHLGVAKVGVLASYPEAAAQAFQRFLAQAGLTVTAMRWLSIASGPKAAQLGLENLIAQASAIKLGAAEALLVPDTAIPAWAAIAPLEERLAIPVLTANQVTLWEALRLTGALRRRGDWGRLFEGQGKRIANSE
jgi:maleate cis-trans isomerase